MKLSRKEEVLLHLSETPLDHAQEMPLSSCQQGIRTDLEMSAAACSFVMAELESERLVRWKMARVPGLKIRVKTYVLTEKADELVRMAMAKLELYEKLGSIADNFPYQVVLVPRAKD